MAEFIRSKKKISFNDLCVYISPNGVIGGRYEVNGEVEDYILSLDTASFQEVTRGEAYDKSWDICTKEEYLKKQKEIKKDVKNRKDKDCSIDMLEMRFSENGVLYAWDIEDEKWEMDENGDFISQADDYPINEEDIYCPLYKAYEERAIRKNKEKLIKEANEYKADIELKDYNFKISSEDDLIALSKEKKDEGYILSIMNSTFSKIDDETSTYIKRLKWRKASLLEAIEVIEASERNIEKRRAKDTSDKLNSVDWWDDPDDYYFENDTNKISYKVDK